MPRCTVLACSILTFSVFLGLSFPALASSAQAAVPADSFIARPAATVSELHQQISLDPVVRRRLARHFHTSAPAVTRYIQNNLVLKKLPKAGRYQVYCISRTGREYTISQRLAAGTPVFVMRSTGKLVLKLACGNPMVASLPPVVTKVAAYDSPELAPAAAPEDAPVALPLQSTDPVVVAMNDTPSVVVMPPVRVGGFLGQLPVVHGGGSGFPFGFLAAIPVLAAVAGTHGSSGTSSTGTIGTNTLGTNTGETGTTGETGNNTLGTSTGNTGNTGVTPVPEPSTPAAFAVGGAFLLFLLTAAKRRSRREAS